MTKSLLILIFALAATEFHSLAADPDLIATDVSVSDRSVNPGQSVTVRWTARNRGNQFVGDSQQGVMWSTNSTIARGDRLLEKEYLGILFKGTQSREAHTIRIPSDARIGGTYYLGVYADYDRKRSESNESNNGSPAVSVTINDPRPDFVASGLTVNDTTNETNVERGQSITVRWTAKNQGADIGLLDGSKQGVMWSSDSVISREDDILLEKEGLGGLKSGQTTPELRIVKVPDNAVIGKTYYVGVYMDFDKEYRERNEANNGAATPVAVRVVSDDQPDLIAENLTVETDAGLVTKVEAWPGQSIDLRWTARNRGTQISGFTAQRIMWSTSSQVPKSDLKLEDEPLGPLLKGKDSREDHRVKVPENAVVGRTYYIAVYADINGSSNESNESNNRSNVVEITVTAADLSDYNDLPYLDDKDGRLRDANGDGEPDDGVTMNRSRCFAPGDTAFIHTTVEHDSAYLSLFQKLPTRLTAYYNDRISDTGRRFIGATQMDVGSKEQRLNLRWNTPMTPGSYYVLAIVEVEFEGTWHELRHEWLDGVIAADAVTLTTALPVVLVHGWSDNDGETFKNLEMMIEVQLKRPVRFFQYETAKTALGNGPQVDQGYREILGGRDKPSLARQLQEFLKKPDPGASEISRTEFRRWDRRHCS